MSDAFMNRRFSGELIKEDTCPRCLGELDTGWECYQCGYDAMPLRPVDWTYSEGCGCRVMFIAESRYRTSRMMPGESCTDHTGRHQMAKRDCLVGRAKKELAIYLGTVRDTEEQFHE